MKKYIAPEVTTLKIMSEGSLLFLSDPDNVIVTDKPGWGEASNRRELFEEDWDEE